MTKQEIIERLNKIALQHFKENWNKTELQRVFSEGGLSEKMADELKEDIFKEISKDKYRLTIDHGNLFIYEIIGEENGIGVMKTKQIIYHDVRLPYNWSMGKKATKKQYKEIVEMYNI